MKLLQTYVCTMVTIASYMLMYQCIAIYIKYDLFSSVWNLEDCKKYALDGNFCGLIFEDKQVVSHQISHSKVFEDKHFHCWIDMCKNLEKFLSSKIRLSTVFILIITSYMHVTM